MFVDEVDPNEVLSGRRRSQDEPEWRGNHLQESNVTRRMGVKRIDENTTELSYTNEEKNDLLKWARTFKMTTEDLEVCLSKKSWRKGLMKTNN